MTTLAELVGVEPDIVLVPDDVLPTITRPVFGHLFGVRHHAIASIEKAGSLLGFQPRYDFAARPRRHLRVVPGPGLGRRTEALRDPVWGASWDFEAEAELAARLR